MISGVVALAAGVGLAVVPVSASASAQRATVAGSVAPVAASSAGTGAVAGSRSQTIQVWLAGDQSAAQAFVDGVSAPGSSTFHDYLSPAAYTQRFGASAQSAAAVRSWLSSEGMSDVAVSPQRDYVSATASTATMDRAFQTQMRSYSVIGARGAHTTIQSNDSALSLPAALAPDVLSVTGLNSTPPNPQTDAAPTGTATTPCSHYWGQHTATLSPALNGLTSAGTPVCGYSADQVRAAYGQTMANDGSGVTIALIESGTPTAMGRTLADYARANRLPVPAPGQFREQVLGKNGTCGNFGDGEEQLDSESAYAMAPGADQLMVDGNPCQSGGEQNVFDAELAPLIGHDGHPSASIESASLTIGNGQDLPASDLQAQHAILVRAAAEGVGMYFATGDSLGVALPASDPDATAVGGTTLGIGAENQVLFQTGWSDNTEALVDGAWQELGIFGAAGGGASSHYDQPAYQKGVVPASLSDVDGRMARTVPDISADADGDTGMLFGQIEPTSSGTPGPYTPVAEGGTSMATPLVAGMVADAQQGQPRSFGFINPLLYSLNGTRAINDVLPLSSSAPQVDRSVFTTGTIDSEIGAPTDDEFGTQPGPSTDQVIAPGYDTVTGLGTPDGQAFIAALRARCGSGWHPQAR